MKFQPNTKPDPARNGESEKPPEQRVWSSQQQAIFEWFENGRGNLVVRARAGSGKTSSILEGINRAPEDSILIAAYNKHIQEDMNSKLSNPNAVARTIHGVGMACIKRACPEAELDADRGRNLAGIALNDNSIAAEIPLPSRLSEIIADNDPVRKCPHVDWQVTALVARAAAQAKEVSPIVIEMSIDDARSRIEWLMGEYDILPDELLELKGWSPARIAAYALRSMELAVEFSDERFDFSDMVFLPLAKSWTYPRFDMIVIDEAQDMNEPMILFAQRMIKKGGRIVVVGDEMQCVSCDTSVLLENGAEKHVWKLNVGDKILAYRNGAAVFQRVLRVEKSSWRSGLRVTTRSGRSLTMSPNHKLWATLPSLKSGQAIVYLMYRRGFGFRIGVTNKCISEDDPSSHFGQRTHGEGADKLWIIEICSTRTKALWVEHRYSLMYGIPTDVFNGENRGVNQDTINKIFREFGTNGQRLLSDRMLEFDYPHWQAGACTRLGCVRRVVRLVAHGEKGTIVGFEWTGGDLDSALKNLKNNVDFVIERIGKRRRIRKWFTNYRHALVFANKLARCCKAILSKRLSFREVEPLCEITASALLCGMSVVAVQDNETFLDEIVSISTEEGLPFVDIEVDDSANFFGDGILSHNSIYSFRGADSNCLDRLKVELKAKELPLTITYRCANLIVQEARRLVADIDPRPTAPQGTIRSIQQRELGAQVNLGDFVLSRVNSALLKAVFQVVNAGKPVTVRGKEIGEGLIKLSKEIAGRDRMSLAEFADEVDDWKKEQIAKFGNSKERSMKARLARLTEAADALLSVAGAMLESGDGRDTIDLTNRIKFLFTPRDKRQAVTFSTCHKIKGDEAERVFVLRDTLYVFGMKLGVQEEKNIEYVAITRAKNELVWVSDKGNRPSFEQDEYEAFDASEEDC